MDLETRVTDALRTLGVGDDEALGVACSGGADSTALTHLLARSRSRPPIFHVDHGLRDSSQDDARFVAEIAEQLGLSFFTRSVTVVPDNGSVEAGARRARYAALAQMADEAGVRIVATAHTLDDQAETVLLRAMRGGALDAIAPVRGMFVRPLLDVRGAELRAWLQTNGIAWRDDPTNADQRFERNWVRGVLLPQMEQRRGSVAAALARIARNARDDNEALDALAAGVFSRAAIDDVGMFLHDDDLDLVPPAVAGRVIRSAFRHLGIEPAQDAVASVRSKRSRHARYGAIDVWCLHDGIAFLNGSARAPEPIALPRAGSIESKQWGIAVRVTTPSARPWLWRAHLTDDPKALTIRSRRPGDRVPIGAGTKKIQDVLVDAKIPRPLRDLVGVLDVDGAPRAVVGYGASSGRPRDSCTVVDVEPLHPTWSRERAWISR